MKQKLFTIKNNYLEIIFSNLGAAIYSVKFNNDQMTLTPKDENDFLSPIYYPGKSIGRITNRVKNAEIVIDEKLYKLDRNDGQNCLHGGFNGLSTKLWKHKITELKNGTKVSFSFVSKEATEKLPGNVHIRVSYFLPKDSAKLRLNVSYWSDKFTAFSFTNHTQFCLGDKNLENLSLKINASKYNKIDESNLLPLETIPVDNVMDFRQKKRITRDINKNQLLDSVAHGYDHFYVFDNKGRIELSNNKYILTIKTDYPGAQIYTHNYPCNIEYINGNDDYRGSVAIEPSLNYLDGILIEPFKKYKHRIEYIFKKR